MLDRILSGRHGIKLVEIGLTIVLVSLAGLAAMLSIAIT